MSILPNKTVILLLLGISLLLTGCGVSKGRFRIRGEYAHLDQSEFFIYSTDGGLDRVDTLHVMRGRFEYSMPINGKATFHILYPNQDELVVWAGSGQDITIEGDAQDLFHAKVSGNADNELYTTFRQGIEGNDTIKLRRAAAAFIRQNPRSIVSQYLLEQHFVQTLQPLPQDSVHRLYQVIRKALPKDNEVALIGGRIKQRYALHPGSTFPSFTLHTNDSVPHQLKDYHDKQLLLYFWAGWNGSSQGTHRIIADSLKQRPHLSALSYSLDIDSLTYRVCCPDTSLSIPIYCDFLGFQSPLVKQLSITQIPLAILINEKGKIIKATSDLSEIWK